jgi:hypothetical protein
MMMASKECPWQSSERQQIKLSLKLWRRPIWQSVIDKKWIAKSTKKTTTRSRWQYGTDMITQTKRIWLKKHNKGWPTKVDSYDIDKLKEINMDPNAAEELKLINLNEKKIVVPKSRDRSSRGKHSWELGLRQDQNLSFVTMLGIMDDWIDWWITGLKELHIYGSHD